MTILSFTRPGLKLVVLALLSLAVVSSAQTYFTATELGDVNVGFRKTGQYQEQYEMVVYAGDISNFLTQAVGTTITISNFNSIQLSNMCPDGFGNLQWSVFASFDGTLTNSSGVWPKDSCWYTVPRTNVNLQTTTTARFPSSDEGLLQEAIISVSSGANSISQQLDSTQGNTNINNNSLVVLEPITLNPAENLTTFIGDKNNSAFGDFGGSVITFSVENITSNNFTSPAVSDFYVNVPFSTSKLQTIIDPLTGLSNGTADYLGYFTLNPNGTMTFTRALAVSVPSVSSVTASATNGFGPLTVVFSDSTSGTATNWVWNFGNGTIITNTTSGSVTNTYATAGSYTVTLTVYGPGGSGTYTVANFIVASPKPKISLTASSGKVIFSGTNCPSGVQYRILASTNIVTALASWKPVYTNMFASNGSFGYTNTVGSGNLYFILVSP